MTPTADTLRALRRGDLAGARELRLPGIDAIPPEIFGLADTLELLDVGFGPLDALPDDLGRLRKLRVLFCSGTRFERLPPVLGDCPALAQVGFRATGLREVPGEALPPALRWLTITDNAIAALPDALGKRPALQKLMLSGNRLTGLPATLAGASNLELLRIAANDVAALPPWIAELPALAWLAVAGNPCTPALAAAGAPVVPWSDLDLGPVLGSGASGDVHRALWRRAGSTEPVALKLFKGAMTSDGLPAHEMAACLAAGAHPHLVGGLSRLSGHPGGTDGLLMPLLPESWRPLANPPDLASCSRDVYAPDLRLAPAVGLRLARAAAAAGAHLHARGILHGDLYAHNLLWDGGAGAAVLSDFGAASALQAGAPGLALQRLEVRAWGILLGEILDRCAPEPDGLSALRGLEGACRQADPGARPLMAEILDALDRAR